MKLILITNNPKVASYATECGVGRIMVDTETLGKKARQFNVNAVFNSHSINDVMDIKDTCDAEIICRINPINSHTGLEIERVIDAGADYLMVPMIKDEIDIKTILSFTNDNIKFIPLLETSSSIIRLKEIVSIDGVSELYFGLNDLSIDMKLTFLHEVTSSRLMRFCSDIICEKVPFGFGGVAKLGKGHIPADLILSEHFLAKSSRVILGRAFHSNSITINDFKNNTNLKNDVNNLLSFWDSLNDENATALNVKLCSSITKLRNELAIQNLKKDI